MSPVLIFVVAVIYLWVAGSEFYSGHYGMAFTFLSYAFANVGLIWAIQVMP
jgi:hypothetical protein